MSRRANPAFSLIEIIVVTSVVSVSFIAVLGLIKRAITLYYSNQNQLMATVIAQDGIELARFIRDENWTTGKHFYENLADESSPSDGRRAIIALDYQATLSDTKILLGREKIKQFWNTTSGNLLTGSSCSGDVNCYLKDENSQLYINNNQHGFYAIRSAITNLDDKYQATIFHRLIETTYYDNGTPSDTDDDFLYVVAKVYWSDHGKDKSYFLNTYLFNYSWRYKYEE